MPTQVQYFFFFFIHWWIVCFLLFIIFLTLNVLCLTEYIYSGTVTLAKQQVPDFIRTAQVDNYNSKHLPQIFFILRLEAITDNHFVSLYASAPLRFCLLKKNKNCKSNIDGTFVSIHIVIVDFSNSISVITQLYIFRCLNCKVLQRKASLVLSTLVQQFSRPWKTRRTRPRLLAAYHRGVWYPKVGKLCNKLSFAHCLCK